MMEDISDLIHGIQEKVDKIQEEEYKNANKLIEIPPEVNLLIKNRNNISSPKDYDDLIAKQKRILNRKKNNKTKTPKHLLENLNDAINLLEDLDITSYQKSWGKLEHELKVNRVMHFIQKEKEKYNLTHEEDRKLKIMLITAINKRLITKKSDVNYSEETGDLIEIHKLEYDEGKRIYSLSGIIDDKIKNMPKYTNSHEYVSHVSKLSPEQNKTFKLMTQNL